MNALESPTSLPKITTLPSSTRRYHATPELTQRLNLIRHLIQNSEQLLLVLAENGCGKTTLLTQLQEAAKQQHEHWWMYNIASSSALSPDALISTMLAEFKVRQDGKPFQVLEQSLRSHIAATRYNGQLPVLLVDDAHMLPLATLKLIVQLAMQGEPLTRMRVVLFCEQQITSILATPEFDIVHNTLIHTLDIPPLSTMQIRDYIQFCLQGTKYTSMQPFSSDVIKRIYAESEGIPGHVNVLVEQVVHKFSEQRPEYHLLAGLHTHVKLLWGVVIIIVMIGIALTLRWMYPELFHSSPTAPITHVPILPPQSSKPSIEVPPPPVEMKQEAKVETVLPVPPPTNRMSEMSAQPLVTSDLEEVLSQNKINGEEWLRAQSPHAYTVQILGAYDYTSLEKLLNQYPLDDIAIYKTQYRGKNWFVLLYGVYPEREQAKVALESLPTGLQQSTHPWLRTLGSVQAQLNGN